MSDLRFQPVSDSRFGQNYRRPQGIILDLSPQIADRDVQDVQCMFVVNLAPNLVYELTVSSDVSLPFRQAVQQRILGARQAQRFARDFNPPAHRVDSKAPGRENFRGLPGMSAPQKRANAGEEFPRSEERREIVIRACIKHSDLLGFLPTNGENQDWAFIEFTDARDNSRSVDIG